MGVYYSDTNHVQTAHPVSYLPLLVLESRMISNSNSL